MWMTQPLSSIRISRLLETCQHANVVGFYAEFHSDTALHWLANRLAIRQVLVDLCAFGFPFKKRVTLFSVSVPVYLKLERRCETFDDVCMLFCPNASKLEGTLYPSGSPSFDMRHSLLVYWFTRSMPRTFGPTNIVG